MRAGSSKIEKGSRKIGDGSWKMLHKVIELIILIKKLM